jgi:NAD(P) transhydrogenase
MRRVDLCVIGSGPSGQWAALQAAKLGKSVCVVEGREVVGGSAVNTGTIPSKALREAILNLGACAVPSSAAVGADFRAAARGATMESLWASASRVIAAEISLVRNQFASHGVTTVHGIASFLDARRVKVATRFGEQVLEAEHFLIATGSEPARPKGIAFDETDIITSDELLHLKDLPRSIIVVGGGVIGTEYASMMAALGIKVTLVEGRPRLMEFVDSEIIEALQYHLRQQGVTLRLGEKVVKISRVEAQGTASRNGFVAEAMLESGKILRADCLLYCVGRQGCTDALNLGAAGLSADARGRISVDKGFRTAVAHIFAAGDVVGFPALASTSMEQGRIAACTMFGVACDAIEELLPYGIYAIPEISMVGWTEERLTAEGVPFESGIAHYRETARGQLLGDDIGMLKLLIHQDSHAILGVHAIGTTATELIHIGQCAIAFKATAEYFVNAVFNYPTLAECYKLAAMNGLNKLRGMG